MTQEGCETTTIDRKYCPTCYGRFENLDKCPNDGAELRCPNNDPLIGTVLADRYDIEAMVGLGGMSVVYRAKHKLMDRVVAIKMLHSAYKHDQAFVERFRVEAQAASALHHQNIIGVHDFGLTPEGEAFFVMDYLDGESLGDLIERKGGVPWERTLLIFMQISDGLASAHKKSILHRDLKPANVVLIKQEDGPELVILVDFGIAKLLPGSGKDQHLTKTGEVFGSPLYMSPEQCLSKELDARSDIYALGCLMYETLVGEPPFRGTNYWETMNKHINEVPLPVNDIAPDKKVPERLNDIVMRCLKKDPAERFQSAEEIRKQIAELHDALTPTEAKVALDVSRVASPDFVPIPNKLNHTTKRVVLGARIGLGVAILCGLAFCAFWKGPIDDSGTIIEKGKWLVDMSQADDAMRQGKYDQAERALNDATIHAKTFGDRATKLEMTLRKQADLYNAWEGHAALLEKVNDDVTQIQLKRLQAEAQKQVDSLRELEKISADSPVARSNAKLRAEAEVPRLLVTAEELYGAKLFSEQVNFLQQVIAVDKKLLGADSIPVTRLQCNLADGLIGLGKYDQVRPLLQNDLNVRQSEAEAYPNDYVRSLFKIGDFDLSQNDWKDAEKELAQAVKKADEMKIDPDLHLVCLRSYGHLLHRLGREAESKDYLAKADAIERGGQAANKPN
jgi:serine/threonine protein kinase